VSGELSQFFAGKELPLAKKTYESVNAWLEKYNARFTRPSEQCSPRLVKIVLEALLTSYGHVMTRDAPYFSMYNFFNARDISLASLKAPKLMFTVLNGGKVLNSKVKFSQFYLIIDINGDDAHIDATEVYFKVTANIKKIIQASKLGEAGFKANQSGSYWNAFESVNDSFKLLEDAINQAQVNTADRKYAQIGVNTDSQSCYLPDLDKYDFEGPKNLFDQSQLVEYLFKVCNDHPLLTYLEDPCAQGDIVGY